MQKEINWSTIYTPQIFELTSNFDICTYAYVHAHMHICKMKRCLLLTVHGNFERNRNIKYNVLDRSLKDYVRSTFNWGWSFIKYLRWQVTFMCELKRCLLLPEQGKLYKNRFRNINYSVPVKSLKVYPGPAHWEP